MGGLELNVLVVALAAAMGLCSFLVARYLRRRFDAKRRAKARAALEATQSRQVRRARERKARGG